MDSTIPPIRTASAMLRKLLAMIVGVVVTLPAVAADSDAAPSAMANAYGAVWLNGSPAPSHSPLFPGDRLQTGDDSTVRISASGSSLTLEPGSITEFERDEVVVETGTANVRTSAGMGARAGDVEVRPASSGWTAFELTHAGGRVQIVALKGDLQLRDGDQTDTLQEGQQATADDAPAPSAQMPHRPTRGKFIKKKYLIYAAIAGGTAVGVWAIVDATSGSSPASPSTP